MTDDRRTLPDLLASRDLVMLTTADSRGRPMTVQDVEGSSAWFLTSRSASWVTSLAPGATVGLHKADEDDADYVSVVGSATQVDDRDRIEELWSVVALAWFDGADDPDLTAIRVDAESGEWWDAPGSSIVRAVRLGAAMAGDRAEVGDQGDVAT